MTIPLFFKEHWWETVSFGKVFHGPYIQDVSVYANHWTYGTLAYDPNANSQCQGGFIDCIIPLEQTADWQIANTVCHIFL